MCGLLTHSQRSVSMLRLFTLLIAGLALAPASAHAARYSPYHSSRAETAHVARYSPYYLSRAEAERVTRGFLRNTLGYRSAAASCAPEGLNKPAPGYVYHRWICGW